MSPRLARAGAVARLVAVGIIAAVLLVPVLTPAVTGHRLIVVDGGSMAPSYLVGDVLLTGPPSGDDLVPGRVVVVGTPGSLYTHRVIEVEGTGEAARARLQGDANSVPDPTRVSQRDVYAVPLVHLGGAVAAVVRGLTTLPGTLVLLAAAVALLLTGARAGTPRPSHRSQRMPRPRGRRAAPAP